MDHTDHQRRLMLQGLGAAGLALWAGPGLGCSPSPATAPPVTGDSGAGAPRIDRDAPALTVTATFAMG